jgi:hypothetical protein
MLCFASIDMPRGVKKGVSKQKFERTVKKIKRKGGAKNPYAVANAKLGRKGRSRRRRTTTTKSRK